MAEHQRPLEAHTKSKAREFGGINSARDEDFWIDHAAAAPFDPSLPTTSATGWIRTLATEAPQIYLCARLGEGEETGTQSSDDSLAEH